MTVEITTTQVFDMLGRLYAENAVLRAQNEQLTVQVNRLATGAEDLTAKMAKKGVKEE